MDKGSLFIKHVPRNPSRNEGNVFFLKEKGNIKKQTKTKIKTKIGKACFGFIDLPKESLAFLRHDNHCTYFLGFSS